MKDKQVKVIFQILEPDADAFDMSKMEVGIMETLLIHWSEDGQWRVENAEQPEKWVGWDMTQQGAILNYLRDRLNVEE
jgi:hypothetical protein